MKYFDIFIHIVAILFFPIVVTHGAEISSRKDNLRCFCFSNSNPERRWSCRLDIINKNLGYYNNRIIDLQEIKVKIDNIRYDVNENCDTEIFVSGGDADRIGMKSLIKSLCEAPWRLNVGENINFAVGRKYIGSPWEMMCVNLNF